MVGITAIGEGKISAKSLPPEARAFNRFLRLLGDRTVIREAVRDVFDKAPSTPQLVRIRSELNAFFEAIEHFECKDGIFEYKVAHGINVLVETTFHGSADDLESLGTSPVKPTHRVNGAPNPFSLSDSNILDGNDEFLGTSGKLLGAASIAMVSDSGSTDQISEMGRPLDFPPTTSACWAYILEAMHLQVVSRTTRIWGRKKIYEVYRLNGPATCHHNYEQIRVDFLRNFKDSYSDFECRSYALERQDGFMFIHLVIGPPFDYTDERNRALSGEKKKKKENEFMFIVKPGSNLMAVTASRAPSRSRFVRFVLTAADLTLASADKNLAQSVVYEPPVRVSDSGGTEPFDLLQEAFACDTGQATGRFAHMASNDEAHLDPLAELQQVSTCSVFDRSFELVRLQTSAQYGRSVGHEAFAAAQMDGAALTMSNNTGVVIDHEAATEREKVKVRGMTFGDGGPQLKKLRFKWVGETKAMFEIWGSSDRKPLRSKCTFTFRGNDSLEGLRELLHVGILQAPLPAYICDVPSLGTSTINVRDGAIVTQK